MLFTRVAPRTKSKGLPIGGPYNFYYFRHALRRAQKARGSIGICVKLVILVIKFPKKFADQRVSSSFSIIQTMSHQIPIGSSIYFSFTVVINIQEVRGIYLYLSASSSSSMQKKDYKALGLSLSSDSAILVKSYEDTKSWAASNALEPKVLRSALSTVKSWRRSSMVRPGR
jgi:hypothetical protein